MSRAFKMSRWVAGWMLAVTLLVSGSSGMVLCIANDGHFAVEPAHQGQCGSPSDATGRTHAEAAQSATNPSVNGASGCVDVSLGLDNVSHVVKDVRHDRLLKNSSSNYFSADYVALMYAAGSGNQRLSRGPTPRLAHALLAQRTIVLRV